MITDIHPPHTTNTSKRAIILENEIGENVLLIFPPKEELVSGAESLSDVDQQMKIWKSVTVPARELAQGIRFPLRHVILVQIASHGQLM